MTPLNTLLTDAAFGLVVLGAAASASAGSVLVPGSGWQTDVIFNYSTPSANSPMALTVPTGSMGVFSLTASNQPHDVYTVTVDGTSTYTSTLSLYPTPFDNTLGGVANIYGPDWLNPDYSHLQLRFGSGNYSLVVEVAPSATLVAGLAERFDLLASVPEPTAWALMLAGMGGLGAAIRWRRRPEFATHTRRRSDPMRESAPRA